MTTAESVTQAPEQLRYARLIDWCTRIGMVVLVATFAIYMLGIFDPYVPVDRLPEVWSQPVGRFLELTRAPTGWGWLALWNRGDIAGLFGIVILAGCSLPCLLALLPVLLRRGDRAFAVLCLAEAAVVALAASGWLAVGH